MDSGTPLPVLAQAFKFWAGFIVLASAARQKAPFGLGEEGERAGSRTTGESGTRFQPLGGRERSRTRI